MRFAATLAFASAPTHAVHRELDRDVAVVGHHRLGASVRRSRRPGVRRFVAAHVAARRGEHGHRQHQPGDRPPASDRHPSPFQAFSLCVTSSEPSSARPGRPGSPARASTTRCRPSHRPAQRPPLHPHRLSDTVEHDREQRDDEPGHDAPPDLAWVRSYTTSNPRPPAPISPAMITTDSAIMIVWFTPSRIDGRASGSCTFSSSWRRRRSERPRRLDDLLRHLPDPQVRQADRRRQGVDHRRDDAGDATQLEQEDHGHQVDERRHRLHRVEDRLERLLEPIAPRRGPPERDRDGDGEHHGHQHLAERVHREVPRPQDADRQDAGTEHGRGRRAARAATRGARCPDDHPPGHAEQAGSCSGSSRYLIRPVADRVRDRPRTCSGSSRRSRSRARRPRRQALGPHLLA